jgi:DNA-binding HxlR family transcriptional regulator
MSKTEHYKKDIERENLYQVMGLLKKNDKLKFGDMEKLLPFSRVTLSKHLRELEESNRIERFRVKGEDRRIEWYRIKPESLRKVEASLRRYEAVKFIESFSNPIYSYKESKDGKKAIAAFVSLPGQESRKIAQSAVDKVVSGNLRLMGLGSMLKLSPDKDAKLAIVIMIRKDAEL